MAGFRRSGHICCHYCVLFIMCISCIVFIMRMLCCICVYVLLYLLGIYVCVLCCPTLARRTTLADGPVCSYGTAQFKLHTCVCITRVYLVTLVEHF